MTGEGDGSFRRRPEGWVAPLGAEDCWREEDGAAPPLEPQAGEQNGERSRRVSAVGHQVSGDSLQQPQETNA